MEQEIVIEAGSSGGAYWRDLWRYRELFYFLAWRDILVRYKQTFVGVAWAVLRPLLTMVVFTVVFGKFAKLSSGNIRYPIMVLAALLPWQFFSNALTESGTSLVSNSNLISKVYFPRMLIPASAVLTSLAEFFISAGLLAAMMLFYGYLPDAHLVFMPAFVLLAIAAAVGAGLWTSALIVKYRDVRIIIPLLVQCVFFISPVGYSSAIVPGEWRLLYSLNPLVGVIDGFRWALLPGGEPLYLPALWASTAIITLMLVSGVIYFRRTERSFADVI